MSITETISQTAATNPVVGVAVATQSTNSAILARLQTGDAGTEALLSAISGQVLEASQLMTALTPHLGQNLNTGSYFQLR